MFKVRLCEGDTHGSSKHGMLQKRVLKVREADWGQQHLVFHWWAGVSAYTGIAEGRQFKKIREGEE